MQSMHMHSTGSLLSINDIKEVEASRCLFKDTLTSHWLFNLKTIQLANTAHCIFSCCSGLTALTVTQVEDYITMNTDSLESFLLVCAADLSRRQHIIHVLQEGLVFYFVVSKDEADAFSMLASCSVQTLQVIHQVGCIVWAGKEKHKINMHTLSSLITNFTASKNHPYVVKCNKKVQQQKTRSHKNFKSSIYVPICMKFLMRKV